jgi:ubiquinone/menaquinone biosynthesis C-methylase UbiE
MEDGRVAAREIIGWTKNYFPMSLLTILEWGCGVARIVRHIPAMVSEDAVIYACDINEEMIKWDREKTGGQDLWILRKR